MIRAAGILPYGWVAYSRAGRQCRRMNRQQPAAPGRPQPAAWADPALVNPMMPNRARVYDYWLGGTHNLVADRELAERMATLDPYIPASCKANRAFLGRAVRFLARQGIRQFVDIGSGIPTERNVHEIARQAAPGSRVVYADIDPVAVAESRAILAGDPDTAAICADLRDPEAILGHPEVWRLIDFTEPAGLILASVLHFVVDASDPYGIVAQLRDAMPPGSHIVVSHATSEGNPALATAAERLYHRRVADGQARTRAEIERFFGGWDLAWPGLVYAPQWRPDRPADVPAQPERFWLLAGVARKWEHAR